jgi:hypothetical protein
VKKIKAEKEREKIRKQKEKENQAAVKIQKVCLTFGFKCSFVHRVIEVMMHERK